ncbi:MAG: hypothetical protein A3H96_02530 [Acidobacteria bacterium RIFCSPLOWO2_02_FULL_67_36]|nr:MAG: hypothetical protein A3H96_02530 [Acidobacteria bacterium RIFCSPLOWO2_02_FULL_67_36]OFW19214.1 MAG: hypothetical protein A3G21_00295 [Acidobacteria bacterium RIFCSPLOWO2_12_FULL_66_21]
MTFEFSDLTHRDIATEHLLLGLLREEGSVATSILASHNLRLDDVRTAVVKLLADPATSLTHAGASREIDRVKLSVHALASLPAGTSEAQALADQICDRLEALKQYWEE